MWVSFNSPHIYSQWEVLFFYYKSVFLNESRIYNIIKYSSINMYIGTLVSSTMLTSWGQFVAAAAFDFNTLFTLAFNLYMTRQKWLVFVGFSKGCRITSVYVSVCVSVSIRNTKLGLIGYSKLDLKRGFIKRTREMD